MRDPEARLSRSMLFVPASRPDMIEKAARSAADALCLDLEDAVAPDRKEASRRNVVEALRNLDFGGRTRIVRVNALDTPYTYGDVIEVVEGAGEYVDLLMLPKTRDAGDVRFLDILLGQVEANTSISRSIGIEAQIETASGFTWLREIAQSSQRLEALIFGSGDYSASIHMPLASIGEEDEHDAAYPGHRWHAAMHAIVAAARANGLRCMDGPYADFKNQAGLERACRIARAIGFDGKQCIHPLQLGITNLIFTPSPEELRWARSVAGAYEQAAAEGRGAISVGGRMVDAANVRMAQTILQRQTIIDARDVREG